MPTNFINKSVIVTVDDDPVILNSIVETLREQYVVRPFTSGMDVLRFLKSNRADLIILDHHMPHLTGLELLQILQHDEKTRNIPVIFLTGSESSEDEIKALEVGAMDYLSKPVKRGSLLTRVRLQLELQAHRNNLQELVNEKTTELILANTKLEQRDKVTLDLLAKASDMRDNDTGVHIERVGLFTKVIVEDLLENPKKNYIISSQYGRYIVDTVKLHDLGKLAMPDNILRKPHRLNDDEYAIIKTHPLYGAKMLDQAIDSMGEDDQLKTALEIVYGHHEKWDGSGYPSGLKGHKIPISARIAAIADVFDALTSERPYKQAWTSEEAFEAIVSDSGRHFDPYLCEVVMRNKEKFSNIVNMNGNVVELVTPEKLGAEHIVLKHINFEQGKHESKTSNSEQTLSSIKQTN